MSIKNIIYDAVTNSLKLLSRRSDQPSVVIPLTPGQLMPVGSIIQSIMTEAEFQAEAGTSWILMDGRSIVGSKLARIKSISVVPDASGRFLRTAGGNAAALAVAQGQATAQNGLNATGGTASLTGTTTFASSGHQHQSPIGYSAGYQSTYTGFGSSGTTGAVGIHNSGSSGTGNTDILLTNGPNQNASVGISSTAAGLTVGDTETRPVNLTVNTFIKIN